MGAPAIPFPTAVKESLHELPVTGKIGVPQDSDEAYKDTMPARRHEPDEDFNLRESMHVLMLANTSMCKVLEAQATQKAENGNGATNKRVTWLMAVFAMVTLMGTGANFLTSSGFAIGGKTQEINQTQKDLQRLQAENDKLELRLREYEVWLQTTREKLVDKGWKLPPLPKGQD